MHNFTLVNIKRDVPSTFDIIEIDNVVISIYTMSYSEFFIDKEKLTMFFANYRLKSSRFNGLKPTILFYFEDTYWNEITWIFKGCGYLIDGGSLRKKHILSILQFTLSSLITCFFGSESMKKIVDSYALGRYSANCRPNKGDRESLDEVTKLFLSKEKW